MKIKFRVGIWGNPAKLGFRADILYGEKDKYSNHLFAKEFSLDKGGEMILPLSFFTNRDELTGLIKECEEE